MNTRITQIRKEFHLTMESFGERIGIGKSSVSLLESGKNKPSEQTIRAICDQFSINRHWLETGEGSMKIDLPDMDLAQEIATLMQGRDPMDIAVMTSLASMPEEWWQLWREKLYEGMRKLKKDR